MVAAVPRARPALPFLSNVTGDWITAEQATDPAYWAAAPARAGALRRLRAHPARRPATGCCVECGPGRQLAGLARMQLPAHRSRAAAAQPARAGRGAAATWRRSVAAAAGSVDRRRRRWTGRFGAPGRRVPPARPTRTSAGGTGSTRPPASAVAGRRRRRPARARWTSGSPCRSGGSSPPAPAGTGRRRCLVLVAGARGAAARGRRCAAGATVPRCGRGRATGAGRRRCTSGRSARTTTALASALAGRARRGSCTPWTLAVARPPGRDPDAGLARPRTPASSALLWLVQALAAAGADRRVQLDLVTAGTEASSAATDPARARHARRHRPGGAAGAARSCARPADRSGRRRRTPGRLAAAELLAASRRAGRGRAARRPALGRRVRTGAVPAARPAPALRAGRPVPDHRWPRRHRHHPGRGPRPAGRGPGWCCSPAPALPPPGRVGRAPGRARHRPTAPAGRSPRSGGWSRPAPRCWCWPPTSPTPAALRRVRERGRWPRFGGLDGIVHAAGLPGGGMAEVKERDDGRGGAGAEAAPARWRCAEAFGDLPLDFVVLCSSVTAVARRLRPGRLLRRERLPGRVRPRPARLRRPAVVSLNWGGWLEVGMAAEVAAPAGVPRAAARRPGTHGGPPGAGHAAPRSGRARLVQRRGRRRPAHWVLDEHRIAGVPVVPGTAHLEAARAASSQLPAAGRRLRGRAARRRLRPGRSRWPTAAAPSTGRLAAGADGLDFQVTSVSAGPARLHVRGSAGWVAAAPPSTVDLAACGRDAARPAWMSHRRDRGRSGLVTFGPHWDCLRRDSIGAGGSWPCSSCRSRAGRPGPVGPASGAAGRGHLVRPPWPATGIYLPLGYGRVLVRGPLPAPGSQPPALPRRYRRRDPRRRSDPVRRPGVEVMVVTDFVLRRVDPATDVRHRAARPAVPSRPGRSSGSSADAGSARPTGRRLPPAARPRPRPQVVVSPSRWPSLRRGRRR